MASKVALDIYLQKWTQLAHECGQVPSVQKCGLELKRNAEDSYYNISQRQVSDVDVDNSVHSSTGI